MCYFLVYLHIYETQPHNCIGSAIFGIPHPRFCDLLGETTFSPKFSKGGGGSEKNDWGDLKSFCHAGYLPGGLLCFLSKKTFKYEIWL